MKRGLDTHLFKSLGFGIDWFCLRHVQLEKLGDPKRNHMDWMIRRGRLRALSLNFWIPLAWENRGLSQRLRIRHIGLPCKERKFCLLGLGRTGRVKWGRVPNWEGGIIRPIVNKSDHRLRVISPCAEGLCTSGRMLQVWNTFSTWEF